MEFNWSSSHIYNFFPSFFFANREKIIQLKLWFSSKQFKFIEITIVYAIISCMNSILCNNFNRRFSISFSRPQNRKRQKEPFSICAIFYPVMELSIRNRVKKREKKCKITRKLVWKLYLNSVHLQFERMFNGKKNFSIIT